MSSFRSPPRSGRPSLTAENVTATVKWYNPEKGFGFVTVEDGSDAFLHVSALASAGVDSLPEGAKIMCDLSQGQKGMQVATVHSVDLSTASAGGGRGQRSAPPRYDRGGRGDDRGGGGGYRPAPSGEPRNGTVKFFDQARGFGFVAPADGGRDVFLHASVLGRAGLPYPADGQPVRFTVRAGKKGDEIDQIDFE